MRLSEDEQEKKSQQKLEELMKHVRMSSFSLEVFINALFDLTYTCKSSRVTSAHSVPRVNIQKALQAGASPGSGLQKMIFVEWGKV